MKQTGKKFMYRVHRTVGVVVGASVLGFLWKPARSYFACCRVNDESSCGTPLRYGWDGALEIGGFLPRAPTIQRNLLDFRPKKGGTFG